MNDTLAVAGVVKALYEPIRDELMLHGISNWTPALCEDIARAVARKLQQRHDLTKALTADAPPVRPATTVCREWVAFSPKTGRYWGVDGPVERLDEAEIFCFEAGWVNQSWAYQPLDAAKLREDRLSAEPQTALVTAQAVMAAFNEDDPRRNRVLAAWTERKLLRWRRLPYGYAAGRLPIVVRTYDEGSESLIAAIEKSLGPQYAWDNAVNGDYTVTVKDALGWDIVPDPDGADRDDSELD